MRRFSGVSRSVKWTVRMSAHVFSVVVWAGCQQGQYPDGRRPGSTPFTDTCSPVCGASPLTGGKTRPNPFLKAGVKGLKTYSTYKLDFQTSQQASALICYT